MTTLARHTAHEVGFDWIGATPPHWNRVRNAGLFRERNERGWEHLELLAVTIANGVLPQREYMEMSGRRLSASESGDLSNYKLVRRGDLVYNRMRMWQGAIGLAPCEGIVSPAYVVLQPMAGVNARYFEYLFKTQAFICEAGRYSYGIADDQNSLRFEDFKTLYSVVPPFEEQRRIAAFLDHETARIDELRQHTKTTIELLLERRATILYRAVSGELTHNELVPSRVPWLERHARGWSDAQVRRVAALGTGHTPSRSHPEYWEECSIPWVTTGEVAQLRDDRVEYLHETREKISEFGLANSAAVLHPKGTVFLSRTASVGFSGIMGTNMATSQDFVTWTCGPRLRPRFLLLCLRAMRPYLLGHLAMGSTHKTIYMPDIESLTIPLPPVEEQDRIVGLTWDLLREIDEGIDALKEHSALLSERRSALIAAAVTGQLDISDWRARSDTVLEGVA